MAWGRAEVGLRYMSEMFCGEPRVIRSTTEFVTGKLHFTISGEKRGFLAVERLAEESQLR